MMMNRNALSGLGMCLDWRQNNSCVQQACAQGPASGVTVAPIAGSPDASWLIWVLLGLGLLVILGGGKNEN